MRLKRKFELKSGYFARFYIYIYKKSTRNRCEWLSVCYKNSKNIKQIYPSLILPQRYCFYFECAQKLTKKGDFVKSSLQNYKKIGVKCNFFARKFAHIK